MARWLVLLALASSGCVTFTQQVNFRAVDTVTDLPVPNASVEQWVGHWQPRIFPPLTFGRYHFPNKDAQRTDSRGVVFFIPVHSDDQYAFHAEGYEATYARPTWSGWAITERNGEKEIPLRKEGIVYVIPLRRKVADDRSALQPVRHNLPVER